MIGIYKITNIVNSKFYIGSAVNIKRRWQTHLHKLRKNNHRNKHFQSAWNDYGEKNFTFEILELVEDKSKLIEREQYWLDLTKCYNKEIGYNKNEIAGSVLGYKFSDEHRLAMSIRNKGKKLSEETKNKIRGRKHTDTEKAKMSAYQKTKIVSEETKRKMSLAQKGRTVSFEHRIKISKTLKGRSINYKRKPITEETRLKMSNAQRKKHTIILTSEPIIIT